MASANRLITAKNIEIHDGNLFKRTFFSLERESEHVLCCKEHQNQREMQHIQDTKRIRDITETIYNSHKAELTSTHEGFSIKPLYKEANLWGIFGSQDFKNAGTRKRWELDVMHVESNRN